MASTVLQPTAELIGDVVDGIGLTPVLKKHVWAPHPQNLTKLPAAVIGLPDIDRTEADERESQLGTDDWTLHYPVDLWFDLSNPVASQTQAAEYVEAFIHAVDTDLAVSASVIDAKVTSARPSYDATDQDRPLLTYECVVEVFQLVAP